MISMRTFGAEPVAKVGGDGVEVATQTIGGESGDAIRLETQLEIMGEYHGIFVFAMTQMERWQNLSDRVYGQPQPQLAGVANPAVELIQLDEDQGQISENTIV